MLFKKRSKLEETIRKLEDTILMIKILEYDDKIFELEFIEKTRGLAPLEKAMFERYKSSSYLLKKNINPHYIF